MNRWQRWGWPVLILVSSLLTLAMYSLDVQSPVRTIISTWFVIVCPGMAYVRLLNLREKHIVWMLAVALSIILTTLVAMVLIYTGQWSLDRVAFGITGVTLLGVLLDTLTRTKPILEYSEA
ncbi:MAG TPA: hypothetical protein VKY59_01915 [Spirillospora sp.]|nr:hypothetical protein [Spirillospora sp.]